MIIGDPSNFAIEFELDEDCGGPWLIGTFGFWIKNDKVGDHDLVTTLRDVLWFIEVKVNSKFNKINKDFDNMDSLGVFELIDDSIYGYPESEKDETIVIENACRFDVCPRVDIFDEWKIYLIEDSEKARLLVGKFLRGDDIYDYEVEEYFLELGVFDEVLKKTYETLFQWHQNELSKES